MEVADSPRNRYDVQVLHNRGIATLLYLEPNHM